MPDQNLVTKKSMELKQFQSSFAEERKKEALAVFKSIPMPKEKDEDWRYTDIGKLRLESFEPFESEGKISVSGFSEYLAEKGVILTDINTALQKYPVAQQYFLKSMKIGGDKFAALNAAYFGNGFFLHVPKNIEIDEPIKLNFEVSGKSSILHNMIIAESNSKVNFIEEYTGKENANGQLNSSVTEVFANADSKINFYHINNWAKNAYSFANIVGNLDRNSNVNWISGCFGGRLNRLKIDTIFSGNGASCSNLGIFMGKEKEHVDFATNMFHNAENTTNDVLVDGILKDESSSVYRGLIKIEKQAQKTNSYLANHILKLGDKTLANSIPSLKIDANDVKASHGATVGQINEEHLFYLMARGLSRAEAEKLIVEGFFEPIIQKIPLEELREKIRGMVGG